MNEPTTDLIESQADLYALLSEDLKVGVDEGRFLVLGPGQNDKPVVIDAETKRWVKGSGRPLTANDPAYIGKVTAFRRSNRFNEAIEQFVPVAREDSPYAITSLEELIEAAVKLAVPEPKRYDVTCPECKHEHYITVDAPPNQKMVEFLIKRLAGDATKTTNVNMHSEEMVRTLSDTRIVHEIEIISLTPEQRAARIRAVQEG